MGVSKFILPFVAAATLVAAGTAHQVTQRQYDFTSGWEGVVYVPYEDVAVPGLLTVCRGITNRADHGWVVKGKKYSQEECFNKEVEIMQKISNDIAHLVKIPVTQGQREILGDFVWNAGLSNFKKSSLLKNINLNSCHVASAEFDRWVYAGNRKWKGLARRRDAEEYGFRQGCLPNGKFPTTEVEDKT